MKNSRGITLASLVVIIASTILLSSLAISTGYRYIKKVNEADETYFKEILSNFVLKREKNYNINSGDYNRIGYYIDKQELFDDIINKFIPKLVSVNKDGMFENGKWYIVDSESAKELGVKDADKYIDILKKDEDKKVKISMVDYISGAVYVFNFDSKEIKLETEKEKDINVIGCEHKNKSSLTCTTDEKCLDCGIVLKVAVGHEYNEVAPDKYDKEFHYTRECNKCGMLSGFEKHSGDTNCYKCGSELIEMTSD